MYPGKLPAGQLVQALTMESDGIATDSGKPSRAFPVSDRAARPVLVRIGLLAGIVAPVLWGAVIVAAGELRPGFDHAAQYISELGERGSSTATLMRYGGFIATGFMHIGYSAAFCAVVGRRTGRPVLAMLVALLIALDGVGRVGAGIFSCEPGCNGPDSATQRLHSLSATLAFLSIAAAACLAAILLWRDPRLRSLGIYSLLSGIAGLILLWLLSAGGAAQAYAGLTERLASGVLTLWIFVTALRLRFLIPG